MSFGFGFTSYTFAPNPVGYTMEVLHCKEPLENLEKAEEQNAISHPTSPTPEPEWLSEVPVSEKIIETAQSYGVANSLFQFKHEPSAVRAGITLKVLEGVYDTGFRDKAYVYAFGVWKQMFDELENNKAHQAEWLIGVAKFLKHEINGDPQLYERVGVMMIIDDLITNKHIQLPDSNLKSLAFLYIENHDWENTIKWLKKANATKTDFIDAAVNFFDKNLFKEGFIVLAHSSQNDVNNLHDASIIRKIPVQRMGARAPSFIKKIAESIMEPTRLAEASFRNELINEEKEDREIDILIRAFCCTGYLDSAIEMAKKADLAKGTIVHLLDVASFLASCFNEYAAIRIDFSEEISTRCSQILDNSSSKLKMKEEYINLMLEVANQQQARKNSIQAIGKHHLCPLETAIQLCQLLEDPSLSYDVIWTKKFPKDIKKATEHLALMRDFLVKSSRRDWSEIVTAFLALGLDAEVIKTAEIWRNWQKDLPNSTEKKDLASDINSAVFFGIAHVALKKESGWDYLKQAAIWEEEDEKIHFIKNTLLYDAVEKAVNIFLHTTTLIERQLLKKEILPAFKAISPFKFTYQSLVELLAKNSTV
jgi:hypothetical protein